MKCFKIKCTEHHPSMETWIFGMALASLYSPNAFLLLPQTAYVDHLPTVSEGLFLEDRTTNMLTTLQFKSDKFIYAMVDNAVKDAPGCFEPAEPEHCEILKRSSVETRNGRLWLTPERPDDQERALVVLNAGLGKANYLDYELNGCQVFQTIGGSSPVILAALSPGQSVIAVRSNWSWWNLLGFNLRIPIERIEISFDGENIHLINQVIPA